MTFEFDPGLWAPQMNGVKRVVSAIQSGYRPILYAPTGGGKTVVAAELFRWATHHGMSANFYLNRRLLLGQTSASFSGRGLSHGIRAAAYDDRYAPHEPLQISSAPTEQSRVIKQGKWQLHEADLVIVDEAHLQKTKTMEWILKQYEKQGAMIVLMTATPVAMANWADVLIMSGTMQDYRACGALVPAVTKCISVPDLRKVDRSVTGEYVLDGRKKKIFTQSIVGDVIENWERFNPDARPTMMYAPGVPESVYLTQQFEDRGVRFCHIDANEAYLDGKRYQLTQSLWEDLCEQYKDGSIKGISNRMKAREGIDLPNTYHLILATPIGSLASYVQTVGRGLRYSPETPDHIIITDHGGCMHTHGSANETRPWDYIWRQSEHVASKMHINAVKNEERSETIVCPKCKTERTRGKKCPSCSFEHAKSSRVVVQEDGRLDVVDGDLIKRRRRLCRTDTESKWAKMYFGFSRKKVHRSFNQMEAFFVREYGYYPPRDLPFMPRHRLDWNEPVYAVAREDLITRSS